MRSLAKTTRQTMEFQADRIEMVLAQHKVAARVTGGLVAPRWLQFQILPALGTKINRIKGLSEELALALGVTTCRVGRHQDKITVEVPRLDPSPVRLTPLYKAVMSAGDRLPYTALLGLSDDGAPLLARLSSPQVAHLLVSGTTGSGKSALLQTVVTSLALGHVAGQLGFVLIDPKRRAFGSLAGLPHLLRPVIHEPQQAAATLQQLVALMEQRDRAGESEPRIVVAVDEMVDLLMVAPEAERPLQRLVQRGREAGLHLVAATQKPAATVVGGLMKANFPVRLVGQVASPEDAKVAAGYGGTGADRLNGPGDFIVVRGGQVTRFQAAYVPRRELAEIVAGLSLRAERPGVTLPEVAPPSSPVDALSRRIERARNVWRKVWKGDDSYEWGGKGQIAAAIFGDGNTSTAGHRNQAVQEVCEALEQEYAERGANLRLLEPKAADPEESGVSEPQNSPKKTTTTTPGPLNAVRRGQGPVEVVVVVFECYERGVAWRIKERSVLRSSLGPSPLASSLRHVWTAVQSRLFSALCAPR